MVRVRIAFLFLVFLFFIASPVFAGQKPYTERNISDGQSLYVDVRSK